MTDRKNSLTTNYVAWIIAQDAADLAKAEAKAAAEVKAAFRARARASRAA